MFCLSILSTVPILMSNPIRNHLKELGVVVLSMMAIGLLLDSLQATLTSVLMLITVGVVHDTVRDVRLLEIVRVALIPHIYYNLSYYLRPISDHTDIMIAYTYMMSVLVHDRDTHINAFLSLLWTVMYFIDGSCLIDGLYPLIVVGICTQSLIVVAMKL